MRIPAAQNLTQAVTTTLAEHAAEIRRLGKRVDTKPLPAQTFGNDTVDTKSVPLAPSGNDGIGFIRVRKRELKGGHPSCRAWRREQGWGRALATTSCSFDLVRAVRVDGKPRHQFVLGLGSQKDSASDNDAALFLLRAIGRMRRHGLNEAQRQALLAELIRKGARRPTVTKVEGWADRWPADVRELVAWLRAADEAPPPAPAEAAAAEVVQS